MMDRVSFPETVPAKSVRRFLLSRPSHCFKDDFKTEKADKAVRLLQGGPMAFSLATSTSWENSLSFPAGGASTAFKR